MRIATAIAMMVVAVMFASTASASYTTEVMFSGDGWYLGDAGAKPAGGYGLFEELTTFYTVQSDMPSGSHYLYFAPDISLVYRFETPGDPSAPGHYVTIDENGIDFDGQATAWNTMGLIWADGYGLALGQHDVPELNPGAVVGDHAWDLDGGGADFTATVWAAKGPQVVSAALPFRSDFAMHRSLTWLSGQEIGTWFGGGLSPLLGGLPLEGLGEALNAFGPSLREWDPGYYNIQYDGSMKLRAVSDPVPEPSTILLLTGGLAALVAVRRRRRA